jgi:hypothetical protein
VVDSELAGELVFLDFIKKRAVAYFQKLGGFSSIPVGLGKDLRDQSVFLVGNCISHPFFQ